MDDLDGALRHDPYAERVVVGALLTDYDRAGPDVWDRITPDDLHLPAHRTIALTIRHLVDRGQPHDPSAVLSALMDAGDLTRIGGGPYLFACVEAVPSVAQVGWYAEKVYAAAVARRCHALGVHYQQAATGDLEALDERLHGLLDEGEQLATHHRERTPPALPPTVQQLVDRPLRYDWAIPETFERSERLVIVGPEGFGKSTLLSQIAYKAAAGVGLWDDADRPPIRVLNVDLENGAMQSARRYERLHRQAQRLGADPGDRLRVENRPEGLDLTRATDQRWLRGLVQATDAQMLVTGSVYKMHRSNPNDEQPARDVTAFLDDLRAESKCVLLLEAHAGHGTQGVRHWRPTGSSLWVRWPEFVRGMTFPPEPEKGSPAAEIAGITDLGAVMVLGRTARGDRRPLGWPEWLRHGGQGEWPWMPAASEDEAYERCASRVRAAS